MIVTNKKSFCFIRVENPPSRTMVAQASARAPKPLIALSMKAHRSMMPFSPASGSRRSSGTTMVVMPAAADDIDACSICAFNFISYRRLLLIMLLAGCGLVVWFLPVKLISSMMA